MKQSIVTCVMVGLAGVTTWATAQTVTGKPSDSTTIVASGTFNNEAGDVEISRPRTRAEVQGELADAIRNGSLKKINANVYRGN